MIASPKPAKKLETLLTLALYSSIFCWIPGLLTRLATAASRDMPVAMRVSKLKVSPTSKSRTSSANFSCRPAAVWGPFGVVEKVVEVGGRYAACGLAPEGAAPRGK